MLGRTRRCSRRPPPCWFLGVHISLRRRPLSKNCVGSERRFDSIRFISWVTRGERMLAVDYMLTKPVGVRSLILASPALSISRWLEDATTLKKTLPESIQAVIAKHESAGSFDSPEYQAAMTEYHKRYLCRRDPWPNDVNKTLAELGMSVYRTMWGPSEFTATGSLRTYERAEQLKALNLPVLLTAGRYDEATPSTTAY